jgi:hypothetical protein
MGGSFLLRRAIAVAGISGLLHACAIDRAGSVAARVTQTDSAVVMDLYTLGAHLRPRAADRGLTIGLAQRSYVFAVEDARHVSPGWHLLWAPLSPVAAVAQHVASLGLEARAGPVDYGLTLGLRVATEMARVSRGDALTLALDYMPAHPERTRLRLCKELATCGMDALSWR